MAYEFHYTPTGTGAISGAEVLEQTEDAINDLGNTAISDVQEALDKAERAFTNSANAVDDAQTALNTANNAEGVAIQAQNDVSNLSGTVTNIGNRVTTAEGNIGNLQGRMTTAEGNITNLQGRMTTAESNIGNLQTAVSTAQATANSAQQTATTARQQSYVFRYSSTVLVASSTNSNALLDNTDNLKVGDKVIDSSGVLFSITAIDTQNSTFTIGTALIDLAQDSDVVHKSGDETIAGVKTFSDDTFVKSLNNTREVTSPSASSTLLLPIVATVTYTDQSPSQSATVNLRISADGSKSFYPNENGLYSLGLVSRNWDNVYSYMFESFGKNLGNEFSNNARTNLYLKANRDTSGQSGVYISRFRQNRAQGEMDNNDVVQITFDILENSVRTNRLWYLNWVDWENDVPKTVEVRSFCEKVDYKLTHINGLNPGALSMPSGNTSDMIDISSYITLFDGTNNGYTPPADGWICISGKNCTAIYVYRNNYWGVNSFSPTADTILVAVPVVAGVTFAIKVIGQGLNYAKFVPCQGNV